MNTNLPNSSQPRYLRGVLWGLPIALLCSAILLLFAIITNTEYLMLILGLAILVGYFVRKLIGVGSGLGFVICALLSESSCLLYYYSMYLLGMANSGDVSNDQTRGLYFVIVVMFAPLISGMIGLSKNPDKGLFDDTEESIPNTKPSEPISHINENDESEVSSEGYELTTDKDRICPYCGGHKAKLELLCYYHEGETLWSDYRNSLPRQAVPSLVQKCPHCGKHYIINAGGVLVEDTADFEWIDPVIWDYFKQSYWAFSELEKDHIVEFNHRFRIWGAYNDEFSRAQNSPEPSDEDIKIFKDNALHLMEFYDDPITKAELHREIGMFDECLKILASIEPESDGQKGYMDAITDFANRGETRPFGWTPND